MSNIHRDHSLIDDVLQAISTLSSDDRSLHNNSNTTSQAFSNVTLSNLHSYLNSNSYDSPISMDLVKVLVDQAYKEGFCNVEIINEGPAHDNHGIPFSGETKEDTSLFSLNPNNIKQGGDQLTFSLTERGYEFVNNNHHTNVYQENLENIKGQYEQPLSSSSSSSSSSTIHPFYPPSSESSFYSSTSDRDRPNASVDGLPLSSNAEVQFQSHQYPKNSRFFPSQNPANATVSQRMPSPSPPPPPVHSSSSTSQTPSSASSSHHFLNYHYNPYRESSPVTSSSNLSASPSSSSLISSTPNSSRSSSSSLFSKGEDDNALSPSPSSSTSSFSPSSALSFVSTSSSPSSSSSPSFRRNSTGTVPFSPSFNNLYNHSTASSSSSSSSSSSPSSVDIAGYGHISFHENPFENPYLRNKLYRCITTYEEINTLVGFQMDSFEDKYYIAERLCHLLYMFHFCVHECSESTSSRCMERRVHGGTGASSTCFDYHISNQTRRRIPRIQQFSNGMFFNYNACRCQQMERENKCDKGDECRYAHCKQEIAYHPSRYKTAPCSFPARSDGICTRFGPNCAFAHGDHDLRKPILLKQGAPHRLIDSSTPTDNVIAISSAAGLSKLSRSSPPSSMNLDFDDIDFDSLHISNHRSGSVELCLSDFLSPAEELESDRNMYMYEYKTRPCTNTNPTLCARGLCPNYHHENKRRRNPLEYHYSHDPCPHVKDSNTGAWNSPSLCPRGDDCPRAHTLLESMYHPDVYKTVLCSNFEDKDANKWKCKWGRMCAHAHSKAELRELNTSSSKQSLASHGAHKNINMRFDDRTPYNTSLTKNPSTTVNSNKSQPVESALTAPSKRRRGRRGRDKKSFDSEDGESEWTVDIHQDSNANESLPVTTSLPLSSSPTPSSYRSSSNIESSLEADVSDLSALSQPCDDSRSVSDARSSLSEVHQSSSSSSSSSLFSSAPANRVPGALNPSRRNSAPPPVPKLSDSSSYPINVSSSGSNTLSGVGSVHGARIPSSSSGRSRLMSQSPSLFKSSPFESNIVNDMSPRTAPPSVSASPRIGRPIQSPLSASSSSLLSSSSSSSSSSSLPPSSSLSSSFNRTQSQNIDSSKSRQTIDLSSSARPPSVPKKGYVSSTDESSGDREHGSYPLSSSHLRSGSASPSIVSELQSQIASMEGIIQNLRWELSSTKESQSRQNAQFQRMLQLRDMNQDSLMRDYTTSSLRLNSIIDCINHFPDNPSNFHIHSLRQIASLPNHNYQHQHQQQQHIVDPTPRATSSSSPRIEYSSPAPPHPHSHSHSHSQRSPYPFDDDRISFAKFETPDLAISSYDSGESSPNSIVALSPHQRHHPSHLPQSTLYESTDDFDYDFSVKSQNTINAFDANSDPNKQAQAHLGSSSFLSAHDVDIHNDPRFSAHSSFSASASASSPRTSPSPYSFVSRYEK